MINKPNKIILTVIIAMLSILGVYTFVIGTPREEERNYNISIIYREPSDSFKLGAYQAAEDLNADIHLISGYDMALPKQQAEYIEREAKNGAQAIILSADDDIFQQASSMLRHIPLVAVCEPYKNNATTCYVGADNYDIGIQLGKLACKESNQMRCVIICPLSSKLRTAERLKGLRSILDQNEKQYDIVYCGGEEKEISAEIKGMDTCILVALDKSLLENICNAAREGDILIGEGYAGIIRTQLETGRLEGIIVYSEYSEGYLSVLSAVRAIENNGHAEGYILQLYKINKENMYEQPGEKIIFPIK